jgi:hypothetical protein
MIMNTVAESHATKTDPVEKWYANATVRQSPRIIVPDDSKGEYLFPKSRQILSDHPLVAAKGVEVVNYVLAQSAYQYMYEIGLLETRFVIDCGLNIVNNVIEGATESEKLDALTIVIDEGYHAHVALDFIIQMKSVTGINPIEVPDTNGNLSAVHRAMERLPNDVRNDFQLISVTIAEHTLTKDLISIGKEKDATRTFTQVMTDHVSDEGRHANYFARLMAAHWDRMPEEHRVTIGTMLPAYLDDYLAGDENRDFDRKILEAAGLSDTDIDKVISETNSQYLENLRSYIAVTKKNLVRLLKRMGVLDHQPTQSAFIEYGIAL